MGVRREPGAPARPAAVVLRDARILGPETGDVGPPRTIVTRGGLVDEISASTRTVPDSVEISLAGLTVLPGLIDAHVHVTQASGDFGEILSWTPSYHAARTGLVMHEMLLRGFTMVRDMGGADAGLARAVEERLVTGPRLKAGGPIFAPTGGHVLTKVCDGETELRRALRAEFRDGADHAKLTLSGGVVSKMRIEALAFSDAEVLAAVDEAHLAHRYIAAHVYTAEAVSRALRLGVRTIEHGNLLDDECLELFLETGAYYVPTLATYWAILSGRTGHGLDASKRAAVEDIFERGLESVSRATAAEVKIGYGTDLHGEGLAIQLEEFALRARVQEPLDVIRSATLVGAEIVGEEGRAGVVREGARADVIAVDGDPLADIGVLAGGRSLRFIMADGDVLLAT
ncbi:amidohydrolase family protein [Sinomonas sp. ASV322]|uniref:metal-dependent hydrolase family protein n=1 Tax=Sinomonas sp. ASV322 TaxID=3041920 RepID=UPI0027DAE1F6|nr:amidohydrolase family protein [Sinomonas sp. ASV322]MDQ4504017.1 amidohydrolase family protein [Sinomonas sp. ASV322]